MEEDGVEMVLACHSIEGPSSVEVSLQGEGLPAGMYDCQLTEVENAFECDRSKINRSHASLSNKGKLRLRSGSGWKCVLSTVAAAVYKTHGDTPSRQGRL